MNDLSLEQCKNLDKLGLPQELKVGDRYWRRARYPGTPKSKQPWTTSVIVSHTTHPGDEYYYIPSLKVLMEFAKTLDECWYIAPCPNGWVITRMTETGMFIEELTDPAPKQAVYKLIEKVKDE